MVEKRKYSWKRSLPDPRDYKFSLHFKAKKQLPTKVDLRKNCSPIEEQSNLGSCTANAGVGALEYLENVTGTKFQDLSRLFVYYNTRLIENDVSHDSGATCRDTVKSLVKYGACSESLLPYNIKKFKTKPSEKCYTDGKKHTATAYYSLKTLTDMKTALANNLPFIFGAAIFSSFEEVGEDGLVKMPDYDTDEYLGGHCQLCVGYSDVDQRFIVRNSWSTDFADKGYSYMPYKYLSDTELCDDFWVISKAKFV
jgi:C1A family cysteine protease